MGKGRYGRVAVIFLVIDWTFMRAWERRKRKAKLPFLRYQKNEWVLTRNGCNQKKKKSSPRVVVVVLMETQCVRMVFSFRIRCRNDSPFVLNL